MMTLGKSILLCSHAHGMTVAEVLADIAEHCSMRNLVLIAVLWDPALLKQELAKHIYACVRPCVREVCVCVCVCVCVYGGGCNCMVR